jgi:DNA-binding GntR family transcriptional regulator
MTIEPSDVPLYIQLADILREQILSGEIPPTQALPSKRELREQYQVAANTVDRAMAVLKAEGLVRTIKGLGIFPRYPEDRPKRE